MAIPVLAHRLILTPEARVRRQNVEQLLSALIASTPVPGSRT